MTHAMTTLFGAACTIAVATACTNFDREDQIKDLRVLGAATTPAEIYYDATVPGGAPFTPVEVSLDVFAFDPRGGTAKTSVDLCAPDESRGCIHVGDTTTDID